MWLNWDFDNTEDLKKWDLVDGGRGVCELQHIAEPYSDLSYL